MSEDSFCAGRIVNNRMMLKALKKITMRCDEGITTQTQPSSLEK